MALRLCLALKGIRPAAEPSNQVDHASRPTDDVPGPKVVPVAGRAGGGGDMKMALLPGKGELYSTAPASQVSLPSLPCPATPNGRAPRRAGRRRPPARPCSRRRGVIDRRAAGHEVVGQRRAAAALSASVVSRMAVSGTPASLASKSRCRRGEAVEGHRRSGRRG